MVDYEMKMTDGAAVVTGAVEAVYMIGTNANVALPGSWSMLGDTIPMPAAKVKLTQVTNAAYVRIISLDLYLYMLSLGVAAAAILPPQIPIGVGVTLEFDNVFMIYYQRVAGDGTLYIVAQA